MTYFSVCDFDIFNTEHIFYILKHIIIIISLPFRCVNIKILISVIVHFVRWCFFFRIGFDVLHIHVAKCTLSVVLANKEIWTSSSD